MRSYASLARHEGNSDLFEVVEMGIISTLWGIPLHIHAEGLRGTGKTTIMRAARQIMPPITRIKNCLYNCDPERPHCPNHKHLSKEEIVKLGVETVPRPFLEISHSAKIGTIAGSIDLAKITNAANPTAALLPGIIPQAHRGIIFIDEINRLADTSPEITDVLLDLMGTKPGRVQIEETGLPVVEIPVEASVWAASNPDEEPGPLQEIRRQLSDRFDLVIEMGRSHSQESIAEILAQSEQRRLRKGEVDSQTMENDDKMQKDIARIANKFESLEMPDFLRNYIARLYVKYNLESFRAIEAIQHAAVLHCALRQRDKVLVSDIVKILPLALRHRIDIDTLTKIMNSSSDKSPNDGPPPMSFATSTKKKEPGTSFSEPDTSSQLNEVVPSKTDENNSGTSIFTPIKQLFSRKDKEPKTEASDEIKAAPLNKAKKIHDLNLDEMLSGEDELK